VIQLCCHIRCPLSQNWKIKLEHSSWKLKLERSNWKLKLERSNWKLKLQHSNWKLKGMQILVINFRTRALSSLFSPSRWNSLGPISNRRCRPAPQAPPCCLCCWP
jgi:hypothetical protein